MAWTVPRTWVTGEIVTASLLNTHLRDNLNSVLPIGTLIMRAANYTTTETAVESRWLQCNGVAVSRTTYSALFSYLNGLTPALPFGNGNGSTTFNIPDLRGRTVYAEGEHADVDNMGDSDAEAIADRSPSHSHTFSVYGAGSPGQGAQQSASPSAVVQTQRTTGNTNQEDWGSFLVAGSYFIKFTS